ncbi:MAG: hypothetical protein GY696_38745 [Gammaproteobacteria bacterium]|nr:hypothetical protein [Gammaproteobacteria bacterium]
MTCFGCGQAGHMKRECPLRGAYNAQSGSRPADTGQGRGGYLPRGSYNKSRGLDRSKMTCFKCLNRGHGVQKCTVPDNKTEVVRQRNLDILTARGMPGAAVNSVQEEHHGPAVDYMTKKSDMQTAFENLSHEGSDFQ